MAGIIRSLVASWLVVLLAAGVLFAQAKPTAKEKAAPKAKPAAKDKVAKPTDKKTHKPAEKEPAKGKEKPAADKPAEGEEAIKPMTPEALAALLDNNKDGKIEDREVKASIDALIKRANAKNPTDDGKQMLAGFDANKDGKLDKKEAEDAVARARLTTNGGKYIQSVFEKLDDDGNGTVSKEEFFDLASRLPGNGDVIRRQINTLYRAFDRDNDGKITLHEAALAGGALDAKARDGSATPVGEDPRRVRAKQLVAMYDKNKDGKLSPGEVQSNQPLADVFKSIDFDLDGFLTAEELWEYENLRKGK